MAMKKINKRTLYESIMRNVAIEVKKYINESYKDERYPNCDTGVWEWDRLEEFLITLGVTPEDVDIFTKYNSTNDGTITEVAFTVNDPDFTLEDIDSYIDGIGKHIKYLSSGEVHDNECAVYWFDRGNGLRTILLEIVGTRLNNFKSTFHILGYSLDAEYIVRRVNNISELDVSPESPLSDFLRNAF